MIAEPRRAASFGQRRPIPIVELATAPQKERVPPVAEKQSQSAEGRQDRVEQGENVAADDAGVRAAARRGLERRPLPQSALGLLRGKTHRPLFQDPPAGTRCSDRLGSHWPSQPVTSAACSRWDGCQSFPRRDSVMARSSPAALPVGMGRNPQRPPRPTATRCRGCVGHSYRA